MKRINRFGGVNRRSNGADIPIAAEDIILRNADMHRNRYSRLADDALLVKQEQMVAREANAALLGLIAEELVKRGLR